MPTDILNLWEQLTPEHQILLTQLMQSLAVLDRPQTTVSTTASPARQEGVLTFLQAQMAEYEAMSPEERAAASADLDDSKAELNANQAPEPPLFP